MNEYGIEIDDNLMQQWQAIVDIIANIMDVPAALIMRIVGSDIEVFIANSGDDNPYNPGAREQLHGSGLYCESVISKKEKLLVPNALSDENWKNNPDIKLNMISYLGFPVFFPDGKPFGTICVLDRKENFYSDTYAELMLKLRTVIQNQIELNYINHILGKKNRCLIDYLDEIKVLRGIIPICCCCKKIRDDQGYWEAVESYISKRSDAQFSHGICPECVKKHYPNKT